MTKTITSKAGLALAAAAAISMSVPTFVEAAPRDGRRYSNQNTRHYSPPARHNSNRGAAVGLVLGAVAIGAILASESRARPPVYYSQPAPTYYEPAPALHGVPEGYWYYCPGANAYYPYVTSCETPWQLLPQQPMAPRY